MNMKQKVKLVFVRNRELTVTTDCFVELKDGRIEQIIGKTHGWEYIYTSNNSLYNILTKEIESVVEPYLISDEEYALFDLVYSLNRKTGDYDVVKFGSDFMAYDQEELRDKVKKVVATPQHISDIYNDGVFKPITIEDIKRIWQESDGYCLIKQDVKLRNMSLYFLREEEPVQDLIEDILQPEDTNIRIPVAELEFNIGAQTIWIHTPDGATALRIKCSGKINTQVCDASHGDIIVNGDINICIGSQENLKS